MTTSIYSNPFSYEKLGPHFKDYLQLCKKYINDEKGLNTSRHHINPKFLTGEYIEDRWNWVHLEHEVHREAHRLLHLVFPGNPDAQFAYNLLKGDISQSERNRKRFEDPLERRKTGEATKKWHAEVGFSEEDIKKISESQLKSWEDPIRLEKASEANLGEKNPMFGKTPWNKGKPSPNKGKKKKRVICEHCGEDVAVNIYGRNHGDKCKMNPINRIS